ncbi:MAG: (d)CMP kinase [Lentisphaeria bacterium]|nr:(d)CMP kinase [Lentisphaeria bacterium]
MSTVVAIDGPAGAGKSTVARKLAARLGIAYINTGSLYRALALAAAEQSLDLNAPLPADFLAGQHLEFRGETLFLNGRDPGNALRSAECAANASMISKQPAVREFLLPVQRDAARKQWIVMEGRDIGTVIFPDAQIKFFVTASLEERAKRRLAQQGEVAAGADLASVIADIRRRDEQDSKRDTAPLRPAEDAVMVDTTGSTIEQVVALLASRCHQAGVPDGGAPKTTEER